MTAPPTPPPGPPAPYRGLTARLAGIVRYPVKAMAGRPLPRVLLTPGQGLPLDRVVGLRNGTLAVRRHAGWTDSTAFLRLLKNASLARYALTLTEDAEDAEGTSVLRITAPSGDGITLRLHDGLPRPDDIERADATLRTWFPDGPNGPVATDAPGVSLWDWPSAAISIINLDTVRALSASAGVPVDHRRFRANLYLEGLGSWREFALVGRRVALGGAELEITQATDRCRATTVNPDTGLRDLNVPVLLASRFGHLYCGVYARVVKGGPVAEDDVLTVLDAPADPGTLPAAQPDWPRYATVTELRPESPTVTTVRLHDPAGLGAAPGQHLRIHLADERGPAWRSYTLTGTDPGAPAISVKRVPDGRISPLVHTLRVGAALRISGPYGSPLVSTDPSRPLFLGVAGVGVTPVPSILRWLAQTAPDRPVTVLNVVRTADDTPLWADVRVLLGGLTRGTGRLHVTAHGPVPPDARHGRPTEADYAELAADPDGEAYLCGPAAFVEAARAGLLAAGLAAGAITDEHFFSPVDLPLTDQPPPEPGPFTVRFAASGVESTWTADDGTLLDLGESVGIRLPSACRAGACGTCLQPVDGDRAHLITPGLPVPPGHALLCCAVPTGPLTVDA
ncbi:MOSC domain-containing protein [Streptomyces sp. NPDC059816]|uniref:MOSC domain-containing protein n=1 Tax=Streptomyces sp. NPDC059816 TaxID=3346960 RepID=UPI003666FB1A